MTQGRWSTVRLGDYCSKIGSGSTPRGGDSVYQDAGVAFIRSQNVYNGVFFFDGLAYVNDELAHQLRGVTVESGDLLLNITGDSVARSCRVPDDVLPARVNQHVSIIRPLEGAFDSRFLGYFLISPFMQATMLSLAGSGGTRKALTKEMIERFDIPKPPRSIQEKIVSILTAYDDLMENNRRRMGLLEEAARQLYREWFVRLRFPGHERVKITNGLPEGWERKPLKEIAPDFRAAADPSELEPGTPYIGLEHMPRRQITLDEWGSADQVTSTKLCYHAGDILFGKIRPYFHKVGFALTDGVSSSDSIILRPVTEQLHAFVLLTVSSDWFVAVVSKTAKEGSKMPRADWNLMEAHEIAMPPPRLLDALRDVVDPVVVQLKTLALQNHKLRAARDLLLPKLMSGEIAV